MQKRDSARRLVTSSGRRLEPLTSSTPMRPWTPAAGGAIAGQLLDQSRPKVIAVEDAEGRVDLHRVVCVQQYEDGCPWSFKAMAQSSSGISERPSMCSSAIASLAPHKSRNVGARSGIPAGIASGPGLMPGPTARVGMRRSVS